MVYFITFVFFSISLFIASIIELSRSRYAAYIYRIFTMCIYFLLFTNNLLGKSTFLFSL